MLREENILRKRDDNGRIIPRKREKERGIQIMLNKKLKILQLITIACAVLMLVAIFLPYLNFAEGVEEFYSDVTGSASYSFFNMAQKESDFWSIIGVYLVVILLAIVMGILKWSIGAIIFSVIGMGWWTLVNHVALSIDSTYVKLGVASYVTYIAGIGLIVAAIMMRMEKKRIKREREYGK